MVVGNMAQGSMALDNILVLGSMVVGMDRSIDFDRSSSWTTLMQ